MIKKRFNYHDSNIHVNIEKCFKNLSNTHIPTEVAEIISLGRNFACKQQNMPKSIVFNTVKNVESMLISSQLNTDDKNKIRQDIVEAIKFQNNCKQPTNRNDLSILKKIKTAQNFTRDNKNVFFTQSDKGNVTVCLDKSEYIEKMNVLLKDNKVYREIKRKPLNTLKNNVYSIFKKLNDNNLLKQKYNNIQLRQTNTHLAKCYGLPKIHKPTLSVRPIISTVNSPTHFLAKVIYENLKTCFPPPKSHIDNSFDLINKLKNKKIPDDHILVSLDVVSLLHMSL